MEQHNDTMEILNIKKNKFKIIFCFQSKKKTEKPSFITFFSGAKCCSGDPKYTARYLFTKSEYSLRT